MQQFTVPQFIDVESKIIGPITTRQFLIFLSAAILLAILYTILSFTAFVIVGVLVFAISGTFAFLKINGRPFHFFVLNLIQTLAKPNLRVWNHKTSMQEKKEIKTFKYKEDLPEKQLQKSRLAELSLIVDTQGKYQGDEEGDLEDIEIE